MPNAGSVAVINLFLGWTFIGWVVAPAMAVIEDLEAPG
ncbi:MAG TPA: superinfection immunity protein [Mycobacterium sp.]|nr:superinfection immunity protein [Mycobacterium sp.]